jgi:hypothetical protein
MPITATPGAIFENWVPVTDGFGYSGQGNDVQYTGRWLAPYSSDTLLKALNLIDYKARFEATANTTLAVPNPTFLYKEQIEQSLYPLLTSQRMSIKPAAGYNANSVNANGTSTDGLWQGQSNATNIIQNAPWALVDLEWHLKPVNSFGINCCSISVNGTGEFNEMGADRTCWMKQDSRTGTGYPLDTPGRGGISVITGNTTANSTLWSNSTWSYIPINNLAKGYTLIEPKDTVTIEYPWVDAALVNLQAMRALRGKINLNDILQWYAGTLLYEGSDVESAMSPLGTLGYKITHHFTARQVDWNLVPVMPPSVANSTANISWNQISYGWASYKPPLMAYTQTNANLQASGIYPNLTLENTYSNYNNRIYQYDQFFKYVSSKVVSNLFYYGFNPTANWYTPPVNVLAS